MQSQAPRKEEDPIGYERHRREEELRRKQDQQKAEDDTRLRRESAILLKAKLITERNRLTNELHSATIE